jgi:hypothetical protein
VNRLIAARAPQGVGVGRLMPPPVRHVVIDAFGTALPPIYGYLTPLLVAVVILALLWRNRCDHRAPRRAAGI